MDLETLQIPLIFVAFFVVASVILSLVYKFGIKEKSYEEAIAEQRQGNQSLLGIKQKIKDKKPKKTTKKTKEKDPVERKIGTEKIEVKSILKPEKSNNDTNQKKQDPKPKIKFTKVIQENIEESDDSEEIVIPQKEVKLLVKKQEPPKTSIKEKIPTRKDEQSKKETVKEKNVHVKKEEPPKKEIIKEKLNNKKEELVKEKPKDEQQLPKEEIEKENVEPKLKENTSLNGGNDKLIELPIEKLQVRQVRSSVVQQNKEKKEIEEKVLVANKPLLTNGYIVNPTKDKKRKKNELNAIQQLTAAPGGPGMAFILNMVHKAELSHSDIQILIDMMLNKQLDAPQTLDDWSEGKSDPVQKLKKQLAEKEKALADEQDTLAGVQIKLKEIRNEQLSERSTLNQKIKTLEEQLQNQQMELLSSNNRSHAQGQQLQQVQMQLNDERMKLHNLREELGAVQMQRQQLEMHIAQESDVMIAQLRADLQEFSARNDQLVMEITHIQKVAADNEASLVGQLNNINQDLAEKSRTLEELHMELANKNEMLYRQESDFKTEIGQINAVMQQQADEIRKTEKNNEELMEEVSNLKKQKNISNKLISQLKDEIEQLQEDKSQNEASMENNKINETEVLNLKNELASIENQLEESERKLKAEVDARTKLLSKLENELEEQKTKNNELRNKNYKIMEALNAAESRIKNVQIANSNKENEDRTSEIFESQKKFISRLLPEVRGLDEITSDHWENECSKLVGVYLESLKRPVGNEPAENLQARIDHYQKVIKDTEGMLNKLQTHIDQEQISWKAQIKNKDLELEALKEKLEKSQNLENINGSSVEGQ